MKTRIIKYLACLTMPVLFIASKAMSQQSQQIPLPSAQSQAVNGSQGGVYTHTLFLAPNKVYGYNIFRDGRIIYHQPAMPQPAGNSLPTVTTKTQADRAALLAIEKIKRGMPAELTGEELKLVTAQ